MIQRDKLPGSLALLAIIMAPLFLAGCSSSFPRSVIVVEGDPVNDFQTALRACVAVAEQHHLMRIPPGAHPRIDRISYATPEQPSFFHQFREPRFTVKTAPGAAAVVTIPGQLLSAEQRHQLANELLAGLQQEFGSARVSAREEISTGCRVASVRPAKQNPSGRGSS